MMANSKLFTPLQLGNLNLKHRVIMAPLTRFRSTGHIPEENVVEYYRQRATDGGLLISEATFISVMAGGYHNAPGIYTPEQVRGWKKVTAAVHERGGYIYCQLWHVGRVTHPIFLGGKTPVAPSAVHDQIELKWLDGNISVMDTPKEMTEKDIRDTIEDYVHAAKMAISAGFDGVELHSANGYLPHQFLDRRINQRTDKYGGSVENRARFPLEVIDALTAAIGAERVGIRLSPFSDSNFATITDPVGDFSYVHEQMDTKGLAYIHIVEPRFDLWKPAEEKLKVLTAAALARGDSQERVSSSLSIKPFRALLKKGTPLISSGNFNATNFNGPLNAGDMDGVVFGRFYISNPDLCDRLRNGWPLEKYDRSTFYKGGKVGYTDYPTYQQQQGVAGQS